MTVSYANRQRVQKAIKLETHIATETSLTPSEVRRLPPSRRRAIADAAGVNPPSTETWRLVYLLLAGEQLPEEYRP